MNQLYSPKPTFYCYEISIRSLKKLNIVVKSFVGGVLAEKLILFDDSSDPVILLIY
jgi:hypothetical protein